MSDTTTPQTSFLDFPPLPDNLRSVAKTIAGVRPTDGSADQPYLASLQPGPVGPVGPAGLGFTYRGAVLNNTQYNPNDVITYAGQVYMTTTGVLTVQGFNPSDWTLMIPHSIGLTGPTGPAGANGAVGPAGATGATGDTGLTGATGPQGPAGPPGSGVGYNPRGQWLANTFYAIGDVVLYQGSSYVTLTPFTSSTTFASPNWLLQALAGAAGATGATGATGQKGDTGAIGPIGPTGLQGPAGAAGAPGAAGPAGAQGNPGATGLTGATGAAGSPGAKGDTGTAGTNGAQGLKGDTGATGPAGPQGATGATGLTGATGPQGAVGPPGSGIGYNPRGAWMANTAYSIGDVVTNQGSSYVAVVAISGSTTFDASKWVLQASAGAVGPSGPAGVAGAVGPAGAQGPAGPTGSIGATGATGPVGPAGATGPTGPAGIQGAIGATGPQGIAGAAGAVGPTGATGLTGATGAPGAGFKYRGGWASGVAYAVNDVVRYLGQTFVVTTAHTSTSTFNGVNFALWAAKGDYGVPFYIRDYGGVEDGATDDTAAWVALIAALTAKGKGAIMLTGSSLCQPGIITLPIYCSVLGTGQGHCGIKLATTAAYANSTPYAANAVVNYQGNIYVATAAFTSGTSFNAANWRNGNFLVDASAASASVTQAGYNTIKDIFFDGNIGSTFYLLRMYYNAHSVIQNVWGNGASVGFLDAVQLWDTRIQTVQLNYCGTSEFAKAIWIRNSGAASGFGASTDTSNQNFITDVRSEDCYGTSLWIEQGTNNTQPPNGMYVRNFKHETNHAISQPGIYIGTGVTKCAFDDIYIAINNRNDAFAGLTAYAAGAQVSYNGAFYTAKVAFTSAASFDVTNWTAQGAVTKVHGIVDASGGLNTIKIAHIQQGAAGVIGSPIYSNANNVSHYEDITYGSGNGAPLDNCVINVVSGAAAPVITGYVNSYPQIPSVIGLNITRKTSANASVGVDEIYVCADASAGSFSLQLPSAAFRAGKRLVVTKTDYSANTITLVPYGAEVISDITGGIILKNWHDTCELLPDVDTPSGNLTGVRGWTLISSVGLPINTHQRIVTDGNSPQLIIETTNADLVEELQLLVNGEAAYIQSAHAGTAYTTLCLQSQGGNLSLCGAGGSILVPGIIQATSNSDAASKGVPINGIYLNGVYLIVRTDSSTTSTLPKTA